MIWDAGSDINQKRSFKNEGVRVEVHSSVPLPAKMAQNAGCGAMICPSIRGRCCGSKEND